MFFINTKKLDTICLKNDNFFVIMDFDKTITTESSLDSWTVLQNPSFMPARIFQGLFGFI